MATAGSSSLNLSPAVAFRGISKTYPNGTVALSDVSFEIQPGTIHAICGENGAGKSTLMKILFGLAPPTAGVFELNGLPVKTSVNDFAGKHGIGMVHQHFSLVPTLTVTENIILGHEPRKGMLIDRAESRKRVEELSKRFELAVDPDAITSKLSIAAQQKVEILKALSRDTKILILDEPTAVLSPPEIEELFQRLHDLRAKGMTILFISHKLNEVRALAESVTVLRGGRLAGTSRLSDIPDDKIMELVMGRAVVVARRDRSAGVGKEILRVDKVSTAGSDPANRISDVSFAIHANEIVGIAGVDGSGQQGLVAVLSGLMSPVSGQIKLDGADMNKASSKQWRQRGLAHLPADRFTQGGVPSLMLTENAIAGTDGDATLQRGPFLRMAAIAERTRQMIRDYSVRAFGIHERLDSLSGGNAQKLIAAREMAAKATLLIVDQPTRGIDVASASFLHGRIDEAARSGSGVLLVSADLDELLRLSDRVLVMFGGRIVANIRNTPDVTPTSLGPFMLGLEVAA